ncbi:TetR/AcrR family transcriptional regulator [Mycobacterium seoulense]|uniref:TetR/AcrR family transcriptional regulator n=1 Tax=Mycobacterium seoulense TaxID=386911 RepID=UPI003CF61C3B
MPPRDADQLPVTSRGRATRDRIISCAAELFVTEGVPAVSQERVRQAASVSGSQLSHYFADKGALIRAVVARQTEVLLDFHRQKALNNLDTFEDFEKWVELTLALGRRRIRHQALPTYGMLAGQLGKHDEQTRELLADGYRQWTALLRRGLSRMKNRGLVIESADPAALANVLVAAHEGGSLMSGAYGKAWPDRDALTFALSYLRQFATHPRGRRSPMPGEAGQAAAVSAHT